MTSSAMASGAEASHAVKRAATEKLRMGIF
jgi:hypothetical protein